jgi:arylsulfatase A-like enzyme
MKPKPNLVLISLDTLRADVAYSGKFPTLERLRREGTCFRTVIAPAPLTPPSHATILTGLQPSRHGIRHLLKESLNEDAVTLASVLSAHGYETGAIVSCPGLNRWYGLGRGFQHYDDEIPPLADGRDALEVIDVKLRGTALKRAPLVVERALGWLGGVKSRPFFLFAHLFDSHWPYEPPEDHGLVVDNPYEGEVAFMDGHLGRLLAGLEEFTQGLADTMIVVLSDHGEDLAGWYANDHAGDRGHAEEEGHGCLLFDTTQLVPLWFRMPERIPAGREISYQVRLCDVMPTVCEGLGLPCPPVDGTSLLPFLSGREAAHRTAYCETFFREELGGGNQAFAHLKPLKAVRLEDRFKVIWEVGGEMVEVYDLRRDPLEMKPLCFNRETTSAVATEASPCALRTDAVERVADRLRPSPTLSQAFRHCLDWFAERPEIGVLVKGSAALGRVDDFSDLDLELLIPGRAPDAVDRSWVVDGVAALGTILSWFPATHLGMENLLVFFVRADGDIAKIDIKLAAARPVITRSTLA